ncbi:aminopeptidase NAALADL1-like [Centropristis striata]|uniref:aminopeptidase NAALADL1-like n=1 Tax=Centropristis striata TaxID=184440 RepID=UPI0027E1B51A|nr:aminopeptidase NAALADL1-like [Centropristis striata]
MITQVVIGIVCGAVVLTAGILIGHFGITKSGSSAPSWVKDLAKDVDESLIEKFMSEVDNIQIKENLRELTKVPHMATTPGDEKTVQLMLNRWQDKETGLDQAWREEYLVYLSFPDPKKPNKVTVVSPTDTVLHTAREKEKLYPPDQDDPDVVQPYAAYSPAGHPKGKLVYANQGRLIDYQKLNETVDLRGTIAITRYGGERRAVTAINAAPYGIVGMLIYMDLMDINNGLMSDVNETYPHSWYLPPSGVKRGSFKLEYGDALTPYLAAKDDTYRIPVENITGIPPFPIQPIGFEDAYRLICELGGEAAPGPWQGAFKCTYNLGGPGFKDSSIFNNSDVKMAIFNYEELRNSTNVMGVIRGSVEPDRYVIFGNHRDGWVNGAVDPSSGTSVFLEVTRLLGRMVKQGKWRPRRSMIFGSWGAEEFRITGSTEYTEQYFTKLSERTVAYINVDIAVLGDDAYRAAAIPSLQNVIFKATKQVDTPGLDSISLYETWKKYSSRTSPAHGHIPKMGSVSNALSDYAAFVQYLGITSMDMAYSYNTNKTNAHYYPAYHTAYETFNYASKFIDPGFFRHQAVGRTAGNILIRLADSLVLPLNCSDYAELLEDYLSTTVKLYQNKLEAKKISMEPLKRAVASFRTAATHLDEVIHGLDLANETPLKIRRINDQLMLLDRAFLNPLAFADKYATRSFALPPVSSV